MIVMTGYLRKYSGAGLVTETLDVICAFDYYFIKTGKNTLFILKYIASGVVGSKAFTGGGFTYFFGLTLHFFIAISFSLFFFSFNLCSKNIFATPYFLLCFMDYLYRVVMNLIVVPVSAISLSPFNLESVVINLLMLIGCFGFPLEFMVRKFTNRFSFHFQMDLLLACLLYILCTAKRCNTKAVKREVIQ